MAARKAYGKRQDWQTEAWGYFDDVPEVKQATWFLGNSIAKMRVFVGEWPDDSEGVPIPVDDPLSTIDKGVAAAAKAELARLTNTDGGIGELLREANMNLEVAAEGFLVGWAAREAVVNPVTGVEVTPAQAERWEIRSISEVEIKGSGKATTYVIKDDPSDRGTKLDPELDTVIRLYQRHPRWSALADCAMRGVLGECEALLTLSQQVIAEGRSKASAGIFTIPNELDPGPASGAAGEGDEEQVDSLMNDVEDALVGPIEDPSHPAAQTPMFLRGPKEAMHPDFLRHIRFDRPAASELDGRIEARVQRLARGLNLPVEKVLGHQQTTFANAEQVDQDTFDDHIEPRCVLLVDALTIGFLRSQLRDETAPPAVRLHPDVDRVIVWFDPAGMIRKPDTVGSADYGIDHGLLSAAAWRREKGWDEDDAPTPEEQLQRAGLGRGQISDVITLALLKLLGVEIAPEALPGAPAPAAAVGDGTAPAGQAAVERPEDATLRRLHAALGPARFAKLCVALAMGTAPNPAALPASARPAPRRTELGRNLMDLDRDLRTRLQVASDAALTRALERAGARLRTKGGRSLTRLSSIPNRQLAATLGPTEVAAIVADAGDLLDDGFTELHDQFMAWGETAQAQALDMVSSTVSGFSVAERSALQLRQATDLEEAWGWLEQHLRGFAHDRLFDPSPAAAELGEVVEGAVVPPGLLRQAIARAGGATIETTGVGGDAWTAITSNGMPVGGIGTGDLLASAMSDHGAGVDGYRWVYGAAVRKTPFEPHVELDGVEFENFDDDVLANTSGFPDLPYYIPGDHGGCICDFEPVIIVPEEA